MRKPVTFAAKDLAANPKYMALAVEYARLQLEHGRILGGRLEPLNSKTNIEDERRFEVLRYLLKHEMHVRMVLPDHMFDCIFHTLTQPAPGRFTFESRNICIAGAVLALAEAGLDPTRNAETKDWPSACSIVAEALDQLGVSMEARTVEEIWNKSVFKKEFWDENKSVFKEFLDFGT
jgi:hypothetical protein